VTKCVHAALNQPTRHIYRADVGLLTAKYENDRKFSAARRLSGSPYFARPRKPGLPRMTSDQVTMDPIELCYTLTQDDLVDGIAAQQRGLWRGWRVALLVVPALLGLAIGFVRSEAWDMPADAVPIIVAATLAIVLLAAGAGLLIHRLLLRRIHLWQARLILRGNPGLSQPIRTTASDMGISADHATGASISSWSLYPLYVETAHSFVLLASKRLGAMALVLPKRALLDDDSARLRAMLDTYSRSAR